MSSFELFIGYLGNGATVCNKAVYENGDYKHVAHISVAGNVKLYVQPGYIPNEDMEKINELAARHKKETEERLDKELKDDYHYGLILEECCNYTPYNEWNKLLNDLHNKNRNEQNRIVKEFYMKQF